MSKNTLVDLPQHLNATIKDKKYQEMFNNELNIIIIDQLLCIQEGEKYNKTSLPLMVRDLK